MKRQPIFNGHTWIVIIVAIISLLLLGLGEEILLFFLRDYASEGVKILDSVAMGTVPLQVVYGIVKIIAMVTHSTYEKDNNKEAQDGKDIRQN